MYSNTKFLTDDAVTDAICWLLAGKQVKCAVAFWGDNKFTERGLDPLKWQIICDVHMGMTSSRKLQALGAPKNANLRHVELIHTKVYISDRGAVIGSANASSGGLAYDGKPARLAEAAVFHPPGTEVWAQASAWFAKVFGTANHVDQAALDLAEALYKPRYFPKGGQRDGLLAQIAANPDRFANAGVCFAFSGQHVDKAAYSETVKEVVKTKGVPLKRKDFLEWKESRRFHGWSRKDFNNLQSNIQEFYIGPGGGTEARTHRVEHRFDDHGLFLTSRFRGAEGFKLPAVSEGDWSLLKDIIDANAGIFRDKDGDLGAILSAQQFALLIRPAIAKADQKAKRAK